jgi:hypothetical protein
MSHNTPRRPARGKGKRRPDRDGHPAPRFAPVEAAKAAAAATDSDVAIRLAREIGRLVGQFLSDESARQGRGRGPR